MSDGERPRPAAIAPVFTEHATVRTVVEELEKVELVRQIVIVDDGFEIDPELSAKLARSRVPIAEVPIACHGGTPHQGKKIAAIDGARALRTLWRYRRWRPPASVAP